jgi:hypothetical protein
MLPPLVDHLNVARRLYGGTPRVMNPALHRLIDESMAARLVPDPDPQFRAKGLDEISRAVLSNPVVAGAVALADPSLRGPGGARSKVAVVFTTDPALAFELAYLERVAHRIPELGGPMLRDPAIGALRGPFEDPAWDGCVPVPESVAAASPGTWLATMDLDPKALPEGRLATPFVAAIASPELRRFTRAWLLQI